ncbi:hypothetical protein [Streptomyces sp. NBC_00878]|uniref:hypothetical protein n=1 Tax=Streptomyces sp. NBC_00878 TaxID=2975854 RepID=UPI0022542756|nr:hypothetical protein [Streptomyces sp. NBC_00878]MCX4911826.1 hypothetical protein [Streptomyces sp. NBC_00878]
MNVHTDGNAVPPVDGTELGDVLEDLDGFNAGIDLIRDGIRHIATSRLAVDDTQTLIAALAGSADGTDVLTAISHLVARLTHTDTNPALRTLPFEQQKTTQRHGENLVRHLADPDLHQHAANACGAIHTD